MNKLMNFNNFDSISITRVRHKRDIINEDKEIGKVPYIIDNLDKLNDSTINQIYEIVKKEIK